MFNRHSPLAGQLTSSPTTLAPRRLRRRAGRIPPRADVDEERVEPVARRPDDPALDVLHEGSLAEHEAAAGQGGRILDQLFEPGPPRLAPFLPRPRPAQAELLSVR